VSVGASSGIVGAVVGDGSGDGSLGDGDGSLGDGDGVAVSLGVGSAVGVTVSLGDGDGSVCASAATGTANCESATMSGIATAAVVLRQRPSMVGDRTFPLLSI
jgi:hypothetical protein